MPAPVDVLAVQGEVHQWLSSFETGPGPVAKRRIPPSSPTGLALYRQTVVVSLTVSLPLQATTLLSRAFDLWRSRVVGMIEAGASGCDHGGKTHRTRGGCETAFGRLTKMVQLRRLLCVHDCPAANSSYGEEAVYTSMAFEAHFCSRAAEADKSD